jgi:hypothetical protein
MIQGYVDRIEQREITGWAYDAAFPNAHVQVEVWLGRDLIHQGLANEARADLERAGIGNGDHAFRLQLSSAIEVPFISRLVVRAKIAGGSDIELRLWEHARDRVATTPSTALTSLGKSSDNDARPIFIVGAARSGTSVVAHSLLRSTIYKGEDEGHWSNSSATLIEP